MSQEIIQFRLLKKDRNPVLDHKGITYILVDKTNFSYYSDRLLNISSLMKKDIDWDQTPDTKEILKNRVDSNSECLLFSYNGYDIGWHWVNDNVCKDWINIDKRLNDNEGYNGGAYVTRQLERPPSAGEVVYHFTWSYLLDYKNKDIVYHYCDVWNRATSIFSYRYGFKQFNFLYDN